MENMVSEKGQLMGIITSYVQVMGIEKDFLDYLHTGIVGVDKTTIDDLKQYIENSKMLDEMEGQLEYQQKYLRK